MFCLRFYDLVKRVMDWTEYPVLTVLNEQQWREQQRRNRTIGIARSKQAFEDADPQDRALNRYLTTTYPPYFGRTLRIGSGPLLCNQAVMETY
jgi:hypothetical protein